MYLYSLTSPQKEAFFCLAHNVVVSDGELSPGEQNMMEAMRREMDLDSSFQPHYLDVDGLDSVFDTKKCRVIVIIALIQLGYADGAFEIEEQSFLKVLCRTFDISDTTFDLMGNWVRRLLALEREANAFL
ncbi:MAG: TerB family tellurite resistance protein [Pseudomonadales bacterium]|jgi:tellurite resistance protein